jgi:hypothetical protein
MPHPFRRMVDYCQPEFRLTESDLVCYVLFAYVTVVVYLAAVYVGLSLEHQTGFFGILVPAALSSTFIGLYVVSRKQRLWERTQPMIHGLARLAVVILAGALVGTIERRFVHVTNWHSQLAWGFAILLDIGLVVLSWLPLHLARLRLIYIGGVAVAAALVSAAVTRSFDPFAILRDGDVAILGVTLWIAARKLMSDSPVRFRTLMDLSCAQAVFILLSGLSML